MKSTIETLSPTRVKLAIEVPFNELEPSLKKAYQEIGAQVPIPGFRKGRVPPAIIDRRVGRGAVLDEAVKDVIPRQIVAAVREHDVKSLGEPQIEVTELTDGESLKFTAELDVRPEISLPDLSSIQVTVDELSVGDKDIDEQVSSLRERFATLKTVDRAIQEGDFVQIDLASRVDGHEVPGGSATKISHEVGSGQLLPGLDEALVGLRAGDTSTFTSALVGGDFAGRDADVAVTVRTVKEKELPPLDDDFAQLASEFDSLDELRADLATRLSRAGKVTQLYAARDKALEELVKATGVPAPEGIVRDEVEQRMQALSDELERVGATLAEYFAGEGKSTQDVERELTEAATEGVKRQIVLDTLADQESIDVSNEEFGHEIVHRAQRLGVSPQQYYDQLVRSGMAATVYADVRRGKALTLVLERVKIVDSAGNQVSLDELRTEAGTDEQEHDHEE